MTDFVNINDIPNRGRQHLTRIAYPHLFTKHVELFD